MDKIRDYFNNINLNKINNVFENNYDNALLKKLVYDTKHINKFHKETLKQHFQLVWKYFHKNKFYNELLQLYNNKKFIPQLGSLKLYEEILVLGHDLGKPFTEVKDKNNYYHYYNHEIISNYIMLEKLNDLFGNKIDIFYLTYIIKNHMLFGTSKINKVIDKMSVLPYPFVLLSLSLVYADHYGRLVENKTFNDGFIDRLDTIYNKIKERNLPKYDGTFDIFKNNKFIDKNKTIILMSGLPGSGKTYIRKELLNKLENVMVLSFDDMRKNHLDITKETQRIFNEFQKSNNIQYLIIDNTNINSKSIRRLNLQQFLTINSKKPKPFNILVISFPYLPLKERRNRIINRKTVNDIPLLDLVLFNGIYEHPITNPLLLNSKNVKIITTNNVNDILNEIVIKI